MLVVKQLAVFQLFAKLFLQICFTKKSNGLSMNFFSTGGIEEAFEIVN